MKTKTSKRCDRSFFTKKEPDKEIYRFYHNMLRGYKTCDLIEKFNPKTAEDLAEIFEREENPKKSFNFPFLLEDKELMEYVDKNQQFGCTGCIDRLPKKKREKYIIKSKKDDIVHAIPQLWIADIWDMSPHFQKQYPNKVEMYMGTNIGDGWLSLLTDVGQSQVKKKKK